MDANFSHDSISKSINTSLLFFRLIMGIVLIINHGWPKMIHLLTGDPGQFADPIGLGAPMSLVLVTFAEVICALLVCLGLFTRWAVVPVIITMLVAIFIIHLHDPFIKMELAIVYLASFIFIGFAGPGYYSLDGLILNRKAQQKISLLRA